MIKEGKGTLKKSVKTISFLNTKKKKFTMVEEKTNKFKSEVRKNITTAILAAFAFIIALVWRDAIQEGVDKLIISFGLFESLYFYKFVVALLVTLICVAGILIFSRYAEKEE